MPQGWKFALTFLAGALMGAGSAGAFVGLHWQQNFANWYIVGVADQANVAREISTGQGTQLADRIRASLPPYVNAVERDFRGAEGREWALWMVNDAYRAAGDPPPDIQPILSALPPRTVCRKPQRKGSLDDAAR